MPVVQGCQTGDPSSMLVHCHTGRSRRSPSPWIQKYDTQGSSPDSKFGRKGTALG